MQAGIPAALTVRMALGLDELRDDHRGMTEQIALSIVTGVVTVALALIAAWSGRNGITVPNRPGVPQLARSSSLVA